MTAVSVIFHVRYYGSVDSGEKLPGYEDPLLNSPQGNGQCAPYCCCWSHLTRLADPLRERRSSGCCSPAAHAGLDREAARLGSGAGETAGVTRVMGADWLISRPHPLGGKGSAGMRWVQKRAFDGRSGWPSQGERWEIIKKTTEFGRRDLMPTPISCLDCLSMSSSAAVSPRVGE